MLYPTGMAPKRIPDLVVYRGDAAVIRLVFTGDDDQPYDVSELAFTPTLRNAPYAFTVNTAEAAQGIVYLSLSEVATQAIATPSVYWDLYEDTLFHHTILNGKLVFQEQA